jgi:transposase
MIIDVDQLPSDSGELKELIMKLVKQQAEDQKQIEKLKNDNYWLHELINARNRRLFGRKSEKMSNDELQSWLFNEAEINTSMTPVIEINNGSGIMKTIQIKEHTRTLGVPGRKPFPENLERVQEVHDLSEEEKKCSCCGKVRPFIKEEISEELDYIPPVLRIKQHVYPHYGVCRNAECAGANQAPGAQAVISAPWVKRIIPGGMASPSLLAQIAISKFCDGLPFYRQEKIFSRYGVEYSRATMCNQMIRASRALQGMMELMWEELISAEVLHLDETTLQVLKEPGRLATTKSWMHVAVGGPKGKKIIIYHYHTSRAGEIAKEAIKGFKGYLQTDGLAAYNSVGEQDGIIHVGCFQHARSKFFEAKKSSVNNNGHADQALELIGKLFKIDNDLRDKERLDEIFVKKRRQQSKPVLNELRSWLLDMHSKVMPKTLLGEAISYCLNQWDKLVRYLDHPHLTPSNETAENAIRPFVIGRKNWLFNDTQLGAHASAAWYSIIESAKMNGLEPYAYVKYLLTVLPSTPKEKLRGLLPHRIDPSLLKPSTGEK